MVLLGPPGAGKGTQAKKLTRRFGVPHVSSGDILRSAVAAGTPLGQEAKSYMDRGELVPDRALLELIEERLGKADCLHGFVLDGFPRTRAQAETLFGMLEGLGTELDLAAALLVSRREIIDRISGRRVCGSCGASFHVTFAPPAREGSCDLCGGALVQRDDDREATVAARLDVYDRETEPLLRYLDECGLLARIDGTGSAEAVFERIVGSVAESR